MTTYHTTTTLNEIRAEGPCKNGWIKLLKHLGKTEADDEPLELLTILESNGPDDAIWCLRVPSLERLSRHFQAWCAEQVLHIYEREYPGDMRVRDQIATLRNDDASSAERTSARATACATACIAASAAACDAAWAAARDVAYDAARAAARVAALDEERVADRASAWDAACDAQEAQLRKMLAGDA